MVYMLEWMVYWCGRFIACRLVSGFGHSRRFDMVGNFSALLLDFFLTSIFCGGRLGMVVLFLVCFTSLRLASGLALGLALWLA